jgi:hypothetical protein
MPSFHAVLFLICTGLLAACATGKKSDVTLLNNERFALAPNESLEKNSQDVIDAYARFFNNHDTVQVPLYKYVKGDRYKLYIGIPVGTSIAKLKRVDPKADTVLVESAVDNRLYRQYKKDNQYVTQYFVAQENVGITGIFGVTASKEISDTVFNEQALSRRIQR